jgi:signal transduction histidine kinase
VIDDEGVVILDLTAASVSAPEQALQALSGSQYQQLQENLGLSELSRHGAGADGDIINRTEIQQALAGEPATAVRRYTWAPRRRILYAAYPVVAADDSVGSVVYIASPLPRINLSLLPAYLGRQMLGAVGLAVALAGLAGFLLARQLTRPLQRLTIAATALARGERTGPVPPAPTRELDRLGAAFNTMSANLTQAHDALAAQASQREAILAGMADAVVAADTAGRIILANSAAATLVDAAMPALREALNHALAIGEPYTEEIIARGQVVELSVTPLDDESGHTRGVVAVGHDVTPYRQLDRMRTGFVSDVSHELRTPLTSIKGTVETLQDGAVDDPEVRDEFLQTIARETERLIRLTDDLLLLTRAEVGRLELRRRPVGLVGTTRRVAEQFQDQAKKKDIRFCVEPADEEIVVFADEDRLYQVLVNLVANALKFSPSGGQVSVSFARLADQATCTVRDSGSGIPSEDLPHVFERFYRGDRSRSRAKGESGTGLGLAIARAIVETHGGDIWIDTSLTRGTAVTFSLPLAP